MTLTEDLFEANRRFAVTFDEGDVPAPPRRRLAVLTCMDARLQPERFLGLAVGDAHVLRNAGGRVSEDVIRSLIISSWELGTTDVVVIHHTRCGLVALRDEDLRRRIADETGADTGALDFLTFADLEESVREDVRLVRGSPFLPRRLRVSGFVYDVGTGRLRQVEPAGPDG